MTIDPDAMLMRDFRSGDAGAFRRLLDRNGVVVYKLAFRYLGNSADAEDVVQEVFLRVYKAARDYEPTAKFSTWVYRITVNVCLNRLRASRARPTVSLDPAVLFDDPGATGPTGGRQPAPSARLEREELEERIRRALASLPETQRTAVLLRRFNEMSYEEIAEVMETTVPAVKSLLARARQTLKSLLIKHL